MPVAHVALPVPLAGLFDYWFPGTLPVARGTIVRVLFGRAATHGVVMSVAAESALDVEALATIEEIVDVGATLPDDLCALAEFVSRYYQQPIGLCCALLVPPIGKRAPGRPAG